MSSTFSDVLLLASDFLFSSISASNLSVFSWILPNAFRIESHFGRCLGDWDYEELAKIFRDKLPST